MAKEVLKPFGSFDVLYYYSKIASKLERFMKGKELAVKVYLPKGIPYYLKRGSNSQPLFIQDLKQVDERMLKLRAIFGLTEARDKLRGKQALIWEYFVPRKLINFFYACNGEHPHGKIERIFIDIDKGNKIKSEVAQKVALELVKLIKSDNGFNKLVKFKIFLMWTGSSFHIYLLLKKKVDLAFYNKHLAYHKDIPLDSFIGRWATEIAEKTGINVQGGHEKTPEHITLDPSGTPSGKLARAPFSLHVKDAENFDGVAVPISEKDLSDKNLVKKLRKLTPKIVLKDLNNYSKLLP